MIYRGRCTEIPFRTSFSESHRTAYPLSTLCSDRTLNFAWKCPSTPNPFAIAWLEILPCDRNFKQHQIAATSFGFFSNTWIFGSSSTKPRSVGLPSLPAISVNSLILLVTSSLPKHLQAILIFMSLILSPIKWQSLKPKLGKTLELVTYWLQISWSTNLIYWTSLANRSNQYSNWSQRTKRKKLYAKCKNLSDINIKCTMILAKVLARKSSINQE